jgi:hypothetical protein
MKLLRVIANELGRGLIAGLAGTVVMTIASTLEMRLRKRPPSTAPADAAGKVLGVQPRDAEGKQRFSNVVHFAYGTTWGLARAAIGAVSCAARRRRVSAVEPLAHLALVWGTALVMLPALGITKPFWRWGTKEVAIDLLHHGVYAAATDGAYRFLERA